MLSANCANCWQLYIHNVLPRDTNYIICTLQLVVVRHVEAKLCIVILIVLWSMFGLVEDGEID